MSTEKCRKTNCPHYQPEAAIVKGHYEYRFAEFCAFAYHKISGLKECPMEVKGAK